MTQPPPSFHLLPAPASTQPLPAPLPNRRPHERGTSRVGRAALPGTKSPFRCPTNPSSPSASCFLRSPGRLWILPPTRVPVGSGEGGGAVGAGGSLPTGDREAETKAVRYHRTAKAAPSPAEPLTRSLGDYPHPK